ncbi:MAG: three-Cys-motif partner protein TcmP [Candidatus Rokuibacteriota bacterium]
MIRRAKDGLPARVSGPWTQEKLAYVERYARAFMTAMAPKRKAGKWSELVYMDFLAGPGRGIDRKTGAEFDGSPLRALKITPPFDRLYFSDVSPKNVEALRKRIAQGELNRVVLNDGDCHGIAAKVVASLSRRTLGLAFVDPEGFEVGFRLFQTLASRPIDILYLFPGGIGIARNLGAFAKQAHAPLDDLIPGWRSLKRAKLAAGAQLTQGEMAARDQPFVMAFMNRMGTLGYQYSGQGEPYFTNEKNVKMYHLLFFSQHVAGLTLWRNITRIEASGQRRLPF